MPALVHFDVPVPVPVDVTVPVDIPVPFDLPGPVHGLPPVPVPPHKRPFIETFAHAYVDVAAQPAILAAPGHCPGAAKIAGWAAASTRFWQELPPAAAPHLALANPVGLVDSSF